MHLHARLRPKLVKGRQGFVSPFGETEKSKYAYFRIVSHRPSGLSFHCTLTPAERQEGHRVASKHPPKSQSNWFARKHQGRLAHHVGVQHCSLGHMPAPFHKNFCQQSCDDNKQPLLQDKRGLVVPIRQSRGRIPSAMLLLLLLLFSLEFKTDALVQRYSNQALHP